MKKEIITKEEMKKEAIKRMTLLNIFPDTIKQFEESDYVSYSGSHFMGGNYWLNEEMKKAVKSFEEKTGHYVFYVIESYTSFGKLWNFLFVSNYKEEWNYDREDIKSSHVFSYVLNTDEKLFSEYGTIQVKQQFGGLISI